MADAADGERQKKLGLKFWIPYIIAMATLAVGYTLAMWFIAFNGANALLIAAATVIYVAGVLGLGLLPWWLRRKMGAEGRMRTPIKRYMLRFGPAMLGYVLVLIATLELRKSVPEGDWREWLLALAPVVPLLFAIRGLVLLWTEQDDEFERQRIVFAYIWASFLTLGLATTWGFLEMYGLVPHVWLWAAFPAWSVMLGLTMAAASWRYR